MEGDDLVPVTRPDPVAGNDANLQLITWGAMALAGIATVALLAIAVSSVFGSNDVNPATTSSTSTTINTTLPNGEPFDLFDYPVTEAVTVVAPRTGEIGQYFGQGAVVTFFIGGGHCDGGNGTIGAGGTIRNDSKAGQALDYVIGFDLIRAFTGSKIAHVEAEVGPVAPGETATWSAEAAASQVVTLRCDLTDITVLPAGSL